MKASSALFAVLLVFWSGASTYWYVCKIKKDCDKQKNEIVFDNNLVNKTNKEISKVAVNKNYNLKDTISVINNMNEKLKNGYTLNNFHINSAVNNIGPDFCNFADNLKIWFEKNSSNKILITGFTDNTGTEKTNLFVGKKRAEFLKSKLIEKGIDKNRIETASEGQAYPVADNETEEGRRLNRRAVITIINN